MTLRSRPAIFGDGILREEESMNQGQIVLNGISEAQLIVILQEKEKLKKFGFAPNQLQPLPIPPQQQGNPAVPAYNNAVLTWQNDDGLTAVRDVITILLHHHTPKT